MNPVQTAALPSPSALGLPFHFRDWRPKQDEAVLDAICSERRFVMAVVPTGGGKTAMYVSMAAVMNARTMILTHTKALQLQIVEDFRSMGLVTVQGMNASRCLALEPGGELYRMFQGTHAPGRTPGCDDGPCRSGVPCSLRDGGCPYYDGLRAAQRARLVVSNYAYWMYQNRYGKGLGAFDLLVCDEGHAASEAVSDFLAVSLEPWEMNRIGARALSGQAAPDQWADWATHHSQKLEGRIAELSASIKQAHDDGQTAPSAAVRECRELQRLSTKYSALRAVNAQWVIHEHDRIWSFTPVWPADYAEAALFRGIPKVLITSATVRPKSAVYLGIPPAQLDVFEYPSSFPISTRPVYHVPTVRVHHKMSEGDIQTWLTRIDQIIGPRLDRKGIIHSVSYARARQILLASKHAAHMIVHASENGGAKLAVEKFKLARPPAILVSPSVTTGHDFIGDLCEYQIVTKLPFPDSRDLLLSARQIFDPEYGMYLTMQTLVQACGRSTRSETDFSECVAPETRVLTDDLRWIPAGDIAEGSRLIGVDEYSGQRYRHRRYRHACVIRSLIRTMPRMRLVFDNAPDIVCTPNHPWLLRCSRALQRTSARMHGWVRTDHLKIGDTLVRCMHPWDEPHSYDEGWLGGVLDGEGCLSIGGSTRNPSVIRLFVSQNRGIVLDRIVLTAGLLGFEFGGSRRKGQCQCYDVKGGIHETFRMLGQTRPSRLLAKFVASERGEGVHAMNVSRVLAVERLTPGPIASLQTSTKTYIAEGFVAHNSFIVDDNLGWLLSKYRHLAPDWFLETVQKRTTLPPPPPRIWKERR